MTTEGASGRAMARSDASQGRTGVGHAPETERDSLVKAWARPTATWGWALAALVGVALYWPSVRYEFTYDDLAIVSRNYRLRDLSDWRAYLATSYWDEPGKHREYRPLTMASLALNEVWARGRPGPYHGVNVFLHGAVSAAAWALIRLLFGRPGLATVVALLFATHPVHVEAVAGVVGRSELQAALGLIAALILGHRSAVASPRSARWGWAAAAGAAALLAVGSKESGLTVAPAIVLLVLVPQAGAGPAAAGGLRGRLRRLAPSLLFTSLAVAVYLAARLKVLGGLYREGERGITVIDNPLVELSGLLRGLSALKVVGYYLGLLIWPMNPSPDYSLGAIPLIHAPGDLTWIGGASLPLILLIGAVVLRGRPASVFGLAFLVVTFAVTSNLFFPIGTMMAERLLYLPSLGFCIVLADVIFLLARGEGFFRRGEIPALGHGTRLLLAAALSAGALALPVQTLRYLPTWRDNATLFEYMARRVPGSARAQYLLGSLRIDQDRPAEAIESLRRSEAIYPRSAHTLAALGRAHQMLGEPDLALGYVNRALALHPDNAAALTYLSELLAEQGRLEEAEGLFARAVRNDPKQPLIRLGYARVLEALGKNREAAEQYATLAALPGEGDNVGMLMALARLAMKTEDHARAERLLARVLVLKPEDAQARLFLSSTLMALGRLEEAEAAALELLRREPENAVAREGLNRIRAAQARRTAPPR